MIWVHVGEKDQWNNSYFTWINEPFLNENLVSWMSHDSPHVRLSSGWPKIFKNSWNTWNSQALRGSGPGMVWYLPTHHRTPGSTGFCTLSRWKGNDITVVVNAGHYHCCRSAVGDNFARFFNIPHHRLERLSPSHRKKCHREKKIVATFTHCT